ncbi:MAG: cytochrome c-type biogenesis CcmF C-terminal domain-containing protein, partial [Pseudomonadota bacterium]
AIGAFSFSLIGAFIVRSGVLTSVHAFANDPDRGFFILLLLLLAIGGSLVLYGWRAGTITKQAAFTPISREMAILINNLFIIVGTLTVLLGTLYPLFADIVLGARLSVGPQYFNATFIPLMLAMIIVLGFAPLLAWKRGQFIDARRRLHLAAIVGLGVLLTCFALAPERIGAGFGIAVAAWLAMAVFADLQKRTNTSILDFATFIGRLRQIAFGQWGSILAHFGVAVFIVGATGATQWQQELITKAKIGETLYLGSHAIRLDAVNLIDGPNYVATRATLTFLQEMRIMQPETRRYLVSNDQTTEAAIHSNLWRDLYTVLGDQTKDGAYVVRIYIKPFALCLWLGVALMVLGGFMAVGDRHLRTPHARKGAE